MSNSVFRRIIQTTMAPKAIGPYSQAVCVNGTLYISGQLGLDPNTSDLVSGGVEEQCRQAFQNMGAILKAAGADYGNVVKTTVLLADLKHFGKVNEIYKEFFKDKFPARATYQVAALPKDGLVEIEAIAVLGSIVDGQ